MNASLFEKYIINQTFLIDICDYLNINSIKNLNILNKNIVKNKLEKHYSNYIVKNSSVHIITKFFKKLYIFLNKYKIKNNIFLEYDKCSDSKSIAFLYFKYYSINMINKWFNHSCIWKKNIILSYNPKIKNNHNRFDIYHMIKKMNLIHIYSIGF